MSADEEREAPEDGSPLTVVHRGAPDAVDAVTRRLLEAEVDAVQLDRPTWLTLFVAMGTYRVRVAVPEPQADRARGLLGEWDATAAPVVRELTLQLRRQVALALIPALLVATVGFFAAEGWGRTPWFGCLAPSAFLMTFLAISAVARANRGRRSR